MCFEVVSGAQKGWKLATATPLSIKPNIILGRMGEEEGIPVPPSLLAVSLTACDGNALSRAGTMPLNSPRTPSALTWEGGGEEYQ